jgi:hypothetical protein
MMCLFWAKAFLPVMHTMALGLLLAHEERIGLLRMKSAIGR